jgi:hypothetical protein
MGDEWSRAPDYQWPASSDLKAAPGPFVQADSPPPNASPLR